MNRKTFDEKLAARAKEITQKSIYVFRDKVAAAAAELGRDCGYEVSVLDIKYGHKLYATSLLGRTILAIVGETGKWPKELFDGTREKLEKEVLDSMNVVQRMMLVKEEDPDGPSPDCGRGGLSDEPL